MVSFETALTSLIPSYLDNFVSYFFSTMRPLAITRERKRESERNFPRVSLRAQYNSPINREFVFVVVVLPPILFYRLGRIHLSMFRRV